MNPINSQLRWYGMGKLAYLILIWVFAVLSIVFLEGNSAARGFLLENESSHFTITMQITVRAAGVQPITCSKSWTEKDSTPIQGFWCPSLEDGECTVEGVNPDTSCYGAGRPHADGQLHSLPLFSGGIVGLLFDAVVSGWGESTPRSPLTKFCTGPSPTLEASFNLRFDCNFHLVWEFWTDEGQDAAFLDVTNIAAEKIIPGELGENVNVLVSYPLSKFKIGINEQSWDASDFPPRQKIHDRDTLWLSFDLSIVAETKDDLVSSAGACGYLASLHLNADYAPHTYFANDPKNPLPGEIVEFDGSGSNCFDDDHIEHYSWDFGDDSLLVSGGLEKVVVSHEFETKGVYNVKLTVTDNDGLEATYSRSVMVGQDGEPPLDKGPPDDEENGCEGDPVNVVNGNLYIIKTDLETASPGIPFRFRRTYNSISDDDSPLGFGWTHEYNVSLQPPDEDTSPAVVTGWDDQEIVFVQPTPGEFGSLPGEYSTLAQSNDGYVWEKKNGRTYSFSVAGQLTACADRNGNSMGFSYDENDRLQSITDTAGRSYQLSYNANGHITDVTGPAGRTVQYGYDEQGNLISITDPAGVVTEYEYNDPNDPHNLTGQSIDSRFEFNYTFDAQDRCIESSGPDGNLRVALDYQPDENRTVVTDARGITHTKYYNSDGRITRVTHADGTEETFTWNNDLNRTIANRRDGSEWHYEYDARGSLTRLVDPDDNDIAMTYDLDDNLTSLTDERSNTTQYEYDDTGNVTRITYPDDSWQAFTYNDRGQPITITDTLNHTATYEYDDEGNLISVTDPDGNTLTYAYDAIGRRTSATDAEGNTTHYTYDALNRVTRVTDALSGEVDTEHETAGLGSLTDQNDNKTRFQYDALDQLTEIVDPLGNTKSYGYDANGNLASRTDFRGRTTGYEYDEMDELTKIDYPAGTDVTFAYDNAGRVTEMVDAIGTTAYVYDSSGRLTSYTNGFGKSVSYTYDAAGNLATLTYPGDKTVAYTYDERNRLAQIEDWAGRITSYEYDAADQLILTRLPNDTRVAYKYDDAGLLTALRNLRSDDSVIASYKYTFDGNGNIIAADSEQPLDPTVQTKVVDYTIGADNRIESANSTPFSYDENGNLTSDGNNAYEYDYENRLTRVITSSDGTWEYLYDGAGRRVQSTRESDVRRFLLDPRGMTHVLAEYDGDGNLTAYYVHGFGLAYKVDVAGNAYSYHYNYTGHTVAMTDGDEDVVNKYAYLPYGELAGIEETVDNSLRYVGKFGVMDERNGLLFMRARYYGLAQSRFLSRDPIGFEGGNVNLYQYVINNPVHSIDPRGLCTEKRCSPSFVGFLKESGQILKKPLTNIASFFISALERRVNPWPISITDPKLAAGAASLPSTIFGLSASRALMEGDDLEASKYQEAAQKHYYPVSYEDMTW